MKPLDEQDHYELLEVSPNASASEIDRAYRLACATYTDGSMAGLSVFEDGDVEVIRARMDAAYEVLMDPHARAAYDAKRSAGLVETLQATAAPEPPESERLHETLEDLDDQGGDFDGPRLRRLRLHRGLELEEVANTTKINPTYLECLEEERFDELPSAVYVRGFVIALAGAVGLDPRSVADSYMARYHERCDTPRKGFFLR